MKGLKKSTLVIALSATSSLVMAEMKALDDTVLSTLTGQAGITIELETQIDLGALVVTDEGNLTMNDIHIGGSAGTVLDNMKIDIDVAADGDGIINLTSLDGSNMIDFEVTVGSVELNGLAGENTQLASNISMQGFLTGANLTVDTATDTLYATAGYNLTDVDLDVDFLGLGIRDVTISSDNSTGLITDAYYQGINASTQAVIVSASAHSAANPRTASGNALMVEIGAFEQDIQVGAVIIGGTSIGSFAIQDQVISNTTLQIYGH